MTPYSFLCKDKLITLVDIPGFDDRDRASSDIFKTVATWLDMAHVHYKKPWLRGIIYVHDINSPNWSGRDANGLKLLERICGNGALRNTWIMLNKSDRVLRTDINRWSKFETIIKGLEEILPAYKGRIVRKHGNEKSCSKARACLDALMKAEPIDLALMDEVERGRTLAETAAGQFLMATMGMEAKIKALEEKMARGEGDIQAFEAELETLRKKKEEMFKIDKATMRLVGDAMNSAAVTVLWPLASALSTNPATAPAGIPIFAVAAVVQTIGIVLVVGSGMMKDE